MGYFINDWTTKLAVCLIISSFVLCATNEYLPTCDDVSKDKRIVYYHVYYYVYYYVSETQSQHTYV